MHWLEKQTRYLLSSYGVMFVITKHPEIDRSITLLKCLFDIWGSKRIIIWSKNNILTGKKSFWPEKIKIYVSIEGENYWCICVHLGEEICSVAVYSISIISQKVQMIRKLILTHSMKSEIILYVLWIFTCSAKI